MAAMTEKTVTDQVRYEISDSEQTYDWSPEALRRFVNQEVRAIADDRPDALIDTDGTLITISDSTGQNSVLSIDSKWLPVLVEGVKRRCYQVKGDGKENNMRANIHQANRDREIMR